MQFVMLINVKIPTVVGILVLVNMITTTYESMKARKVVIFSILASMSSWNFMLSYIEHE